MWFISEQFLVSYPEKRSNKAEIAAFDFVNTLIYPASGDSDYKNIRDWVWAFPNTKEYLEQLNKEGWKVIIVSNYGIGNTNVEKVKALVDDVISQLDFEIEVYLARSELTRLPGDYFSQFFRKLNEQAGLLAPIESSFYCSHLGPPTSEVPLYRNHINSGNLLADKLGFGYYNPLEIFEDWKPFSVYPYGRADLLIFVGASGSGRAEAVELLTTMGYTTIRRSDYKFMDKVIRNLSAGNRVVFNATNPTKANREELITSSRQLGVESRIIWFVRPGRVYNVLEPKPVPEAAYTRYIKSFEDPRLDIITERPVKVIRAT